MAKSIVDGVLFSDGELPGEEIQHVVITISKQNALPSDLKKKMALKVKALGGNAVSNFEVAQSGHHWVFTASPFMWDSEINLTRYTDPIMDSLIQYMCLKVLDHTGQRVQEVVYT